MAFGKRTDDVIGSVPNNPKLTKYIMMSKQRRNKTSDDENIVKQLDFKKEDLFDHFENDDDINFLSFESEGFIPIEEDFNKLKNLFLDSFKEFPIQLSNEIYESNDYIFTPLNDFELKNSLKKLNSLNLFLTCGFFEFERIKGPLFFIPLIFQNNFFKRDYNKDIKFNYLLKVELENEYNIALPDINLNVEEYLNELKDNKKFKVSDKSFIGNFDFRNLLIYNDLTLSDWYNSYDKFKSFFENNHIYSIDEFKQLNNNIAKKWPNLNLEYTKDLKMKGADTLITNLLSNGNSILYVSNYYSKNEVKKSLTDKYLNSLILDFDYNLDKYSIFKNIKEDLFSLNNKMDISSLAEIKIYNENMSNILKEEYSNLNLTPLEMKEKLDEFSHDNFDLNLNINNDILDNLENIDQEINDVINNSNLTNIIINSSEDLIFDSNDYNDYIHVFDSILDGLDDLKLINQDLNEKFGLNIFDNLTSPQYLENFNLINEESKYIDNDDYEKINEFLKVYYDYQNLKDNGLKIFSRKLKNYVESIVKQKTNFEIFNDKFDEINSLAEYLDISNCSFNEYIKYLSLLFKHPKLVLNENELNNIVKIIEEYQNEKDFDGTLLNQLKEFWTENDEIDKILTEVRGHINSENQELYNDVKDLSNLFADAGFNFKTLNEYFNLKDKLISFANAKYVEDNRYFQLNEYLKDFLKTYDVSLNEYLDKVHCQLIEIFNEIKEIIHYRYSIPYKNELFNNIVEILKIQKDLGFNFVNFKELVKNEEFIKYLNARPNFNLEFDNESLVDIFEKIQGFNISGTINEYINLKIKDYVSVIQNINGLAEEYLKENYDWSYIKLNIQKINRIKEEIGVNFNSLNDFKNNESVFDILIQKPQLNYNIEDYEYYLDIYKICQYYETYDLDELSNNLTKEYENYLKLIKDELKPILSAEYDLIFIKDKITEIEGIIVDLSELINCIKIDKFTEIDDFVNNIQILKNNPTFIEDYNKFDSYIETINFLKNPNLLDEAFLNECNSKLVKFNDLPFEEKLTRLEEIIDICYDNNTSIWLLNTKKDFANLMDNISKLNIDCKIINNLDLDEAIASLKPQFNLIQTNKNRDLKLISNEEIEVSILQKTNHYSTPNLIGYELKSKNNNLNKQNDNSLFNKMDNEEIYAYLKNKNVLKDDVRNELELFKEYLNKFNDLYDKIYEFVISNLNNINEFALKEEEYYNKIVEIMEISCPNSFKGLQSNINDLKNEFENNKYFTQLVEASFFNQSSYDNLSYEEINILISKLKKSKNELIRLCENSKFNLEDTFDNILNYINNLLSDIEIFKKNYNEIFSLNYLKQYISNDLLDECSNLNKNILKLSNLDKQFIKKYFKDNYGLKVKENIKLVDSFNNLIKDNVFTDDTIKFLDNTSQEDIISLINELKICLNSVYDNLIKKEFNLLDPLSLILEKIEIINKDNLKLKNDIDFNSYLVTLVSFSNYKKYYNKFSSFIEKYDSKLNLNNQCHQLNQIIYELDILNKLYCDENYKNKFFALTNVQINNELLRLKNNLIFNNLVNSGKISNRIPDSTNDLIHLMDETKEIINETDYNVDFNELIKDNKNVLDELNGFNEKYENISNKLSDGYLEFLSIIPEIITLFNEYSIYSKRFLDYKENISKNMNLIKLSSSLEKNLFNLSKKELNEYTINMDLNKEFSDLINSKIFFKSVNNFYKENYKDKLKEMESLSFNIVNSSEEIDLDKKFLDLFESDTEELLNSYSEIMELKEKDLNDTNELIENHSLLINKIYNLNNNKLLSTDYSSYILMIKEKIEKFIELNRLEVEIQKNKKLIIKHFNGIINSDPFSINQIHEKLHTDLEFTKYYHEKIFSDRTIENSEFLQPIDLSFDDSILKLYNSMDYNDIYNKNKFVIKEINNFENGLIEQKEFLINVNELFNNDKIDSLLKLNIDSQLIEYESRLDDLKDIYHKYFDKNDNLIRALKNHIALSEIIDNKLFADENVIKSNLDITSELTELMDIYYSLLKDIYKISEFYIKYPYFKLDQNSFSYEISFETLNNNMDIFEQDLIDINHISKLNPIVLSLIRQSNNQNIEFNKISNIFKYNIYNYILNDFYENFPEVKGKNLDYHKYKKEIDKIDKEINKNQFNQVLTEVYGNLHQKGNNELILNQKNLLNQKINNKKLGTIKEILNDFKEYILSVKPVFMMDINQFYEYISREYESLFDYVILDKNFEFEELDTLTLFLRSKNKLIDLR